MSIPEKNSRLDIPQIKDSILKYLYKSDVKINIPHEHITSMKDMDAIKNGDYIVCPRFSGVRSWIIFFRKDNMYYAVNFPKHSQMKRQDLNIYPINIRVHEEMYDGTIMEGIYFKVGGIRHLIIDEVYKLAGENQMLKSKDYRLFNLANYINMNVSNNDQFVFRVCKYYNTSPADLSILYDDIKINPNIQELIFYPKFYGKTIYSYTIIDVDLIDDIIRLSVFLMEKTSSPDVYKLVIPDTKTKVGIAYIPTIEISAMCKSWFKGTRKKSLIVRCQQSNENEKWIPIEVIDE